MSERVDLDAADAVWTASTPISTGFFRALEGRGASLLDGPCQAPDCEEPGTRWILHATGGPGVLARSGSIRVCDRHCDEVMGDDEWPDWYLELTG